MQRNWGEMDMFMTRQWCYGHTHGVKAYPAVYANTCGLLDVRHTSTKLLKNETKQRLPPRGLQSRIIAQTPVV